MNRIYPVQNGRSAMDKTPEPLNKHRAKMIKGPLMIVVEGR
jgi:hypothetical protein